MLLVDVNDEILFTARGVVTEFAGEGQVTHVAPHVVPQLQRKIFKYFVTDRKWTFDVKFAPSM